MQHHAAHAPAGDDRQPFTVEVVSKLSQRDHQAGDFEEGQEHLGLALIPNDEPAEVSEPSHGPFDRPAAAVAA